MGDATSLPETKVLYPSRILALPAFPDPPRKSPFHDFCKVFAIHRYFWQHKEGEIIPKCLGQQWIGITTKWWNFVDERGNDRKAGVIAVKKPAQYFLTVSEIVVPIDNHHLNLDCCVKCDRFHRFCACNTPIDIKNLTIDGNEMMIPHSIFQGSFCPTCKKLVTAIYEKQCRYIHAICPTGHVVDI
jgi:hypothetical protein